MSDAPINEIAAALAAAQAEIKGAALDGKNPHFRSEYSTLQSVIDASRPLAKHGIAFVQISLGITDGCVGVETILIHASGQQLRTGPVLVPVTKQDAHGIGSAFTYAKRYSLGMACGISSSGEDDDGNRAVTAKAKSSRKQRKVTEEVLSELPNVDRDLAADYASGIVASVAGEGVESIAELFKEVKAQDKKQEGFWIAVWNELPSHVRNSDLLKAHLK